MKAPRLMRHKDIFIHNFIDHNNTGSGWDSLKNTMQECLGISKNFYRIAVIAPDCHELVNNIVSSFGAELLRLKSKKMKFFIEIKISTGSTSTIRSAMDHMINEEHYDVLLTLGLSRTLIAKDVTMMMEDPPPIVFCGFTDPLGWKVVESFPYSGSNITGVAMKGVPYDDQVNSFLKEKPETKKVLVVYHTGSQTLEYDRERIEQGFNRHGVATASITIKDSENIREKLQKTLRNDKEIDTVVTLRDNIILPNIDTFVEVCKKEHVTLFASDWYSVEHGAEYGYGFSERITGEAAARKAYLILTKQLLPSQIPITTPDYAYKLRAKGVSDS